MVTYLGNVNALVAQLDRVFGYEPKGQGFESLPARQSKRCNRKVAAFIFCIKGTRRTSGTEQQSGGLL